MLTAMNFVGVKKAAFAFPQVQQAALLLIESSCSAFPLLSHVMLPSLIFELQQCIQQMHKCAAHASFSVIAVRCLQLLRTIPKLSTHPASLALVLAIIQPVTTGKLHCCFKHLPKQSLHSVGPVCLFVFWIVGWSEGGGREDCIDGCIDRQFDGSMDRGMDTGSSGALIDGWIMG